MKRITFSFNRVFLLALAFIGLLLLAACSNQPPPEPTATPTSEPQQSEATPVSEEAEAAPAETEEQLIITPTPAPTATPGPLNDVVAEIAESTGLDRQYLLGLSGEDWINLLLSLIIVLVGITLVAHIFYRILKAITRRTTYKYDDIILDRIKREIIWIISVFIIELATDRLQFISTDFKQTLDQLYTTIYTIIITIILWKLLDLGFEWWQDRFEDEKKRSNPFIPLLQRMLRIALLLVTASIILNNYGVNITGIIAVLGIGGLAFSLAAQDTLADAISGFIILMDQPFREGDRIEIDAVGTWGDVVTIGTRSTRIRTRDNRMVIVPNSTIAKSQIVNYTYPDPRYRVQIEIGVEYGVILPEVRKLIKDSVRVVEGVLPDKPVDVLFLEFGDPGLILRVRWWIDSYVDTRRMFDKVNEEIYKALNEANIELPPKMYDLRIMRDPTENEGEILDRLD